MQDNTRQNEILSPWEYLISNNRIQRLEHTYISGQNRKVEEKRHIHHSYGKYTFANLFPKEEEERKAKACALQNLFFVP
jgi:hypothetical protein